MRVTVTNEGKTNKRIGATRFVSSFTPRWLVVGLVALLVLAGNAGRASAAEPPPVKPIPIVTMPYWTAGLAADGVSLAVSDVNDDGYLEIIASTSDGGLAAWDSFGNPLEKPVAMPTPVLQTLTGQLTFTTTLSRASVAEPGIVTATVSARERDHEVAQFVRRMRDPAGRGFDLWPGDGGNSVLVGDDEGLTLWRIGGQSLRFATGGRPLAAWIGQLTPNGPSVVVALTGKRVHVFGAATDMTREGLLWRVPRPANAVQTSLDEDNAQELDKTGRKWWVFGSGETIHLIRNDGQDTTVQAPGSVTHVRLGDLNGDGASEIVVSLDDGRLVAQTTDGQTRSVWQTAAGPKITRLDAADLTGEGRSQVLVFDESPAFRLYAGDGQEIARLELPFPSPRHLIVDINNDGKQEIVIAASDESGGALIVTDAQGRRLWQREQTAADWIAPLRAGGRVRAITADNGDEGLVAYSPDGALLWRYTAQGAVYYDPADLRGDGTDGILLSGKTRGPMVALDGNGREVWKFAPKPNIYMNTTWAITNVNGVRALFESWYTLAAGDNVDQPFVTRLDPTTGKEAWTIRTPQTTWAAQAADADGNGQPEVWAFIWPGAYRMDAETGAYLQVSPALWSNNWFRVTNLDGSGLDQVAFFDSNGAEAHGLVADQPPWAGTMRVEAGQAGLTNIALSNLLAPGKSSTLSVTLSISLPVTGLWASAGPVAREEKTGRLLWATGAFGPWDAGQKRAYELHVADSVYTLTLTGTLAIPAYAPASVAPIEGGRYNYRLPLNTMRVATVTLQILRPGSQTWQTQATAVIPPGASGQWDVAPFGVWDSDQTAQARFVLDDGVHAGAFAQLSAPLVGKQTVPQVEAGTSGYQLSGQVRDPHAVTLTVELLDPVVGWSIVTSSGWVEAAQAVVPAGGGAFAVQVRSFYDAFDVGHSARYRIWADDGTKRAIWVEASLPPIAGFAWWGYLLSLTLLVGAGSSAGMAIWRQRAARRLEREMQVARSIQESLMPETVPSVPGLDIAGGSNPALEVGGDFFGYYRRESSDLGVAVGDVSGKGLPAALLMAVSVGILAAEANRTGEPGAVLDHINASLEYYTRRNRLNTALCYVMLSQEKRDGQTTCCVNAANAGGISPLVRHADGRVEWLDVRGLPLGIANANETSYAPQRTELQSGDLLVLTSDGVIEAMNAARQIFSFERFEQAVAESKPVSSAASVREEILSKMRTFGAGVSPHDDVTLVVIRVV